MSNNVTKADLIIAASAHANIPSQTAALIIEHLFGSIKNSLAQGRPVTLVGFGAFRVNARQARQGRNPQTKQLMQVPGSKVAKFTPGKPLKAAVNR